MLAYSVKEFRKRIQMAQIVWSQYLRPPAKAASFNFKSDLFPKFPKDILVKALDINHTTVELPEGITRRTLSRAGILLAYVCRDSLEVLKPFIAQDPFSVGLYSAIESGPVDFQAAQIMNKSDKSFSEGYRENVNPKMYFHSMPSLPAAHLSIYLGIQGRVAAFTDSVSGGRMAILQAERDLNSGQIQAALVCGAFSHENPFVVLREHQRCEQGQILCEGAAAVILVPDSEKSILSGSAQSTDAERFGNCQDFFELEMCKTENMSRAK